MTNKQRTELMGKIAVVVDEAIEKETGERLGFILSAGFGGDVTTVSNLNHKPLIVASALTGIVKSILEAENAS